MPADLAAGLAAIRDELDVPGDFPPEAVREAEDAARAPLPAREDRRDLELFTIDPPSSMDLDQAMALSRSGDGYRVDYAIADVAAFVEPGGALDAEAHRRVLTRYLPDGNAPLHPHVLSEGAASLLPGVDRLAVVWSFALEPDGAWKLLGVERALVRSRERFAYASAPVRTTSASACSPRSARSCRSASGRAARSTCRSPSRRSSCVTAATRWPTAGRCRSRRRTPRSR